MRNLTRLSVLILFLVQFAHDNSILAQNGDWENIFVSINQCLAQGTTDCLYAPLHEATDFIVESKGEVNAEQLQQISPYYQAAAGNEDDPESLMQLGADCARLLAYMDRYPQTKDAGIYMMVQIAQNQAATNAGETEGLPSMLDIVMGNGQGETADEGEVQDADSFREDMIHLAENVVPDTSYISQFEEGIQQWAAQAPVMYSGTFTELSSSRYQSFYTISKPGTPDPRFVQSSFNQLMSITRSSVDKERIVYDEARSSSLAKTAVLHRQWREQIARIDQRINCCAPASAADSVWIESAITDMSNLRATMLFDVKADLFSQEPPSWKDIRMALADDEAVVEIVRLGNYNDLMAASGFDMNTIKNLNPRAPDFMEKMEQFQQQMEGNFEKNAGRLGEELDTVKYLVFILEKEVYDVQLEVLDITREEEEQLFAQYKYQLYSPDEFSTENTTVYDRLWRPIVAKIADKKTVYFTPDGLYSRMSPEVLMADGRYLLEQFQVRSLISSASVLRLKKEDHSAIPAGAKAVLFGVGDFGKGTNATSAQCTMPALTSSIEEVEGIGATLASTGITVERYLEAEATEERFKQVAQPYLLHMATHSTFDTLSITAYDKLAAGGNNQEGGDGLSTLDLYGSNSPIWRSRLIFSNYNQYLGSCSTTEPTNGAVSAQEVVGMDLRGTALVNLSSCRSGLGSSFSGVTPYGLQRAFFTAGAQNVISSLENVSDEEGREFMNLFYRFWLKDKMAIQEAFYQTKLEMMNNYPFEPQYWAIFQLVSY